MTNFSSSDFFPKFPEPQLPAGWRVVTHESLSAFSAPADLGSYFDGAEPDLATIRHPSLRPLSIASDCQKTIRDWLHRKVSGILLLSGPSGEGKTTALLQAVAMVITGQLHDEVILGEAGCQGSVIEVIGDRLSQGKSVIVALDGAESHIGPIDELIRQKLAPAQFVQFILATRDTDWFRAFRALNFRLDPVQTWRGNIEVQRFVRSGEIRAEDASRIVDSWIDCSAELPEHLQGKEPSSLAYQLQVTSGGPSEGDGALLGALLDVRFANTLIARLATLMERLSETSVTAYRTLNDILVTLAAVDVAQIAGVRRGILAEYCGIPEGKLRSEIEVPLGREAVASSGGSFIHIRHSKIARTVFQLCISDRSDIAIEYHLDELIDSAARNFEGGDGYIVNIGHRLLKYGNYQKDERIQVIAINRARRAVEARPFDLSNRSSLSAVLRKTKNSRIAVADVWKKVLPTLDDRDAWADWNYNIRGTWSEASCALTAGGDVVGGAFLAAVSLSDRCGTLPISNKEASIGLSQFCRYVASLEGSLHPDYIRQLLTRSGGIMSRFFPDQKEGIQKLEDCCRRNSVQFDLTTDYGDLIGSLETCSRAVSGMVENWLSVHRRSSDCSFSDLKRELANIATLRTSE